MAAAGSTGDRVTHPRFPARPRGAWATAWWGKAWLRAVEESSYDESDLRAGRTLARSGGVGGLTVGAGELLASVVTRDDAWTVRVGLPVLDEPAGAALVEVVAAQAGRLSSLLSGDLPHQLLEDAEESGVELLPYGGELDATCSCDAWTQPCRHGLAVLLQAGWLIDADPLVLLHLRGLPREQLLARLHALTTDDGDADLEAALEAALAAESMLEAADPADPAEPAEPG